MIKSNDFDVENVFSRWITLRGQVEESWVKTPRRFIEAIDLKDSDSGDLTDQGIKIISKNPPEELDTEEDVWITIDE